MRRLAMFAAAAWAACAAGLFAPAAATAVELPKAAVVDTLMPAVIAEAGSRRDIETDSQMRHWISEIEGYYRVVGTKPLWVGAGGLTGNGRALASEIANAYAYGLDNTQFQLPDLSDLAGSASKLADAEVSLTIAAVKYIWHARGGRVDPSTLSLWLDQKPRTFYASELLGRFADVFDAAAVLRSYHPKHPEFEALRQAYLKERGLVAPEILPAIAPGPKVLMGQRHPDVIAMRQRLGYLAQDPAYEDMLDRRLMGAIREVMFDAGYARKNAIDDDVRREVSKIDRSRPGTNKALIDKMLVNLERWRWMPESMGSMYVWNNLPEFYTRVVKDGAVIHQEKIVIGTAKTQTPVFSDSMSHVIFQPEWGVPESIKIRQLLPRLKAGDYGVLDRRNMKVVGLDGKKASANKIKWSKVDIRNVGIVQGAGPDNPLGRLKFIFPNGHDVYMHDTPSKSLFETSVRTHSHGCIRVKNPDQFAEVILGEQGWTKSDVKAQLARSPTFKVDLKKHVAVHNTYFTVTAAASGKVNSFTDMYGHDRRVLDALRGKSIAAIAAADPALALKRENKALEQAVASVAPRARPRVNRPAGAYGLTTAKAPGWFAFKTKPAPPPPSYLRKSAPQPKPFAFFTFQ